jgi:hypothetical protein
LRAGFGDDFTLTVTFGASCNIGEAAEDTLLHPLDLAGAIAVGASDGLSPRFGADTLAKGTVFGT